MKILFKKAMLEELKKAVGDREKHGTGRHYEMVEVHGKNGTFMRRQEVGRKKRPENSSKPETQKEEPKTNTPAGDDGEHSYVHTRGDHICFVKNGQRLTGEIYAMGRDGVKVHGTGRAKGQDFNVFHRDIKQVTKMINPDDAIRDLLDKGKIKPLWRGTDGMQPENCDTIEGLLAAVGAAREEFSGITDGIRAEFEALNPIVMKRPSLKSVDRIKEKLRTDQKENDGAKAPNTFYEKDKGNEIYHCRTIRDCDGHTLCLNSIADVAMVLKHLDGQDFVARIKNNFAKPSKVGYSDINANIKLSNGVIVEMQINTVANMVAKERYGHALFEVFRSVENNPEYVKLAALMGEAQKALYGLSNRYSKEGNFPAGDIPKGRDGNVNIFDRGYRHEPFAVAIRKKVAEAMPLFRKAKADGTLNETTVKHFEQLVEYIR